MRGRREQFEAAGYVDLRGFLSAEEVVGLRGEVDRYIGEVSPRIPPTAVYWEDRRNAATLKQLTRMHEYDAYFRRLLEESRFRSLAEELLGTAVTPKNLQYFDKPPAVSAPTPPHQDGYYFMIEPNEALTMWLALDAVSEENGCVRYVAGSQRGGMRPHGRTQILGFSQGITDYGEADYAMETAMPAMPGDLLAHHSLTIHRAEANRSGEHRRSLGFIYYSVDAREDTAAHAEYQRRLAEELSRAGRI